MITTRANVRARAIAISMLMVFWSEGMTVLGAITVAILLVILGAFFSVLTLYLPHVKRVINVMFGEE